MKNKQKQMQITGTWNWKQTQTAETKCEMMKCMHIDSVSMQRQQKPRKIWKITNKNRKNWIKRTATNEINQNKMKPNLGTKHRHKIGTK
jgi:hypothetical protein